MHLGRRVPTDFEHVRKYPLTLARATAIPSSPVVLGVRWYEGMDSPTKVGNRWMIGRAVPGDWGQVRGGHAICARPKGVTDHYGWWSFYDQGSEGACFPAGTFIEMADGSHKPIEQVRTLERVRTAEGNEGAVLQTMARLHLDGLVRLKLRGHGHLTATSEHPVLTKRGYVEIGSLKLGDRVRLPGVLQEATSSITTSDWLAPSEARVRITGTRWMGVGGRAGATATITSVPEKIKLTPAFGRIVGLWLAEGSTSAARVSWHFGGHERETLVPELVDLLAQELGVEARTQTRGNGAQIVHIYGKHWRSLFERMLSHGPYDKSLAPQLASGPRDFLAAVLQGWLDGDGHQRGRGYRPWTGVTISHRLALAMYRIAQGLGRAPTIRGSQPSMNRHAATRKFRWDVEISEGQQAEVDDGGAWRKVVGIEHEDWAGHVFNLHVEGDESYVAEGVGVHNCVGFACSRAMSLANRHRYNGFSLYHEAQMIDEYEDTPPAEGTSIRAGLEVLRTSGPARYGIGHPFSFPRPDPAQGISAYRWCRTVPEVLEALGRTGEDAIPLANSWGRSYKQTVWLPVEGLARLLDEDGEAGVIVNR